MLRLLFMVGNDSVGRFGSSDVGKDVGPTMEEVGAAEETALKSDDGPLKGVGWFTCAVV